MLWGEGKHEGEGQEGRLHKAPLRNALWGQNKPSAKSPRRIASREAQWSASFRMYVGRAGQQPCNARASCCAIAAMHLGQRQGHHLGHADWVRMHAVTRNGHAHACPRPVGEPIHTACAIPSPPGAKCIAFTWATTAVARLAAEPRCQLSHRRTQDHLSTANPVATARNAVQLPTKPSQCCALG